MSWEEQIPFYVAGTLTKAEATRLERHLAGCAECRRSLDDWQRIATAVRADAASQLRGLPPLAPRVIATANRQAVGRYGYAPSPLRQPSRTATTSLTLMAAVFTVILFGGLLAFMVLNSSLLQQTGESESSRAAAFADADHDHYPGDAGRSAADHHHRTLGDADPARDADPPTVTPTLEFLVVTPVPKLPTRVPTSAPYRDPAADGCRLADAGNPAGHGRRRGRRWQ